jgi:predicted nucleotidyltransferase
MNSIVRQTRPFGTSSGVLLPRAWLNKEVVVTLVEFSKEKILKEVIEILSEKNILEDVIGIYLSGSYARGDYEPESDIDLIVVTNKTNKAINKNNYEITLVSEENLLKNYSKKLYLFSSIREAIPLMNSKQLDFYKKIKPQINKKDIVSEIKRILKLNGEIIGLAKENGEKTVSDATAYSLVLRLRELYLTRNKDYNKEDFLDCVGEESYNAYVRTKRGKKDKNEVSVAKAEELANLTEKWLKSLKT